MLNCIILKRCRFYLKHQEGTSVSDHVFGCPQTLSITAVTTFGWYHSKIHHGVLVYALFFLVSLFGTVLLHVTLQMTRSRARVGALLAVERFFTSVDEHVRLQATGS